MTPETLAALDQAKRDKRPVVLATQTPVGRADVCCPTRRRRPT